MAGVVILAVRNRCAGTLYFDFDRILVLLKKSKVSSALVRLRSIYTDRFRRLRPCPVPPEVTAPPASPAAGHVFCPVCRLYSLKRLKPLHGVQGIVRTP